MMFRAFFLVVVLFALAWGTFYFFEAGELPLVGGTLADAKTTTAVKAALALRKDLSHRSVSVRTHRGAVTLTGEVATEAERARAEEVARSVTGVQAVDNLIAVTPGLTSPEADSSRSLGQRFDDTALAAKVKGAYALHRELKDLDISVEVRGATVFLKGHVRTRREAELARRWALAIDGVAKVESALQVTGEPRALAFRIESALRKNEYLKAYGLRARLHTGEIVLEGEVSTGAERQLAGLLAEREAGQLTVRNEIRVKQH